MKNQLIIVLTALFLTVMGTPQTTQAQSFEKGLLSISPGLNLGNIGFYGSGTGIPLVASAEFAILEYVGVGPYAGFVNYSFGSGANKYRYTFISVGVRGDFHYNALLEEILEMDLNSDKVDLYIGILLGYQTTSYSGPDGDIYRGLYNNRGTSGVTVGGRYYFNKNLAVFAEAGRSLYGALNVGLTLRLK